MRQLRDSENAKLQYLTAHNVEIVLLEPTVTGLTKSIMDATKPIRDYLLEKGLHDYQNQRQGPDGKILLPIEIILSDHTIMSQISLYRPITKMGDPRLWVYGITQYCAAHDVLALLYHDGKLKLFNLTQLDVQSLGSVMGPLKDLLLSYSKDANLVAKELLAKLQVIAAKGFIRSDVDADTAIGRLLESELGIAANSSKNPDYKGIEIKSYRSERSSRKNLFTQVPNWSLSRLKSSRQILDAFGYDRAGIKKLYCTVSTRIDNSQGLRLALYEDRGFLVERSNNESIGEFIVWETTKLRQRLSEKHAETFWVEADVVREANSQHFKFTKVEHTKSPMTTQLETLLAGGQITVDHLIKERGSSASEKGPIFKLSHNGLPLLFPPSEVYRL